MMTDWKMTREKKPAERTRIKACIAGYDSCSYTKLQFLRAMSHNLDIHSATFLVETISDDNGGQQQQTESVPSSTEAADATSTQSSTFCDVCLVAPCNDVVLVPCRHSRFCAPCTDTVAVTPPAVLYPVCRSTIDIALCA